jgi:hypothetical protein
MARSISGRDPVPDACKTLLRLSISVHVYRIPYTASTNVLLAKGCIFCSSIGKRHRIPFLI